jgi:hypothetical protein
MSPITKLVNRGSGFYKLRTDKGLSFWQNVNNPTDIISEADF